MNMPKISTYYGIDVLRGATDETTAPSNTPYWDVFRIAQERKCPIVLKNGEGQWYFKAPNRDIQLVKKMIDEATQNKYPRHTLYLIEHT
jgi:hypothetical protein